MMNKSKLAKEGKEWVDDGIITDDQLKQILGRYKQANSSLVFISFAVLFISIGILLFVFTDWTYVSPLIRIILLLVVMLALYSFGFYFNERKLEQYGISFIILGYIFFGATLFFLSFVYNVPFFIQYQFIIWTIVGLGLIYLYRHQAFIIVGLIVTIAGQWIGAIDTNTFSWILLLIYLFGYFHFVYHYPNKWANFIFTIGLVIQSFIAMSIFQLHYYWLIPMFFVIYVLSLVIPKKGLQQVFLFISMTAIFILRSFETVILPDQTYDAKMKAEPTFFIFWGIVTLLFCIVVIFKKQNMEWINIIIFLPLIMLNQSPFLILICMFIVSLYWVIISYQKLLDNKIPISMTIFIISTVTAYVQFGWESMNRSLFFIIGGVFLFIISFFFERQRRKVESRD